MLGPRRRRFGLDLSAEDLSIRAAQVVAVKQSQVNDGARDQASLAETQRVRRDGRRHPHQLRAWPRRRQHCRCFIVANGDTYRHGINHCKFTRAGENLDGL